MLCKPVVVIVGVCPSSCFLKTANWRHVLAALSHASQHPPFLAAVGVQLDTGTVLSVLSWVASLETIGDGVQSTLG